MSVPTTDDEPDVEKRFLDDVSQEASSRSTSEDGDFKWSPAPNTFRRHQTSWLLLAANILTLGASLWANRSALWDENYCIRQTSFFCTATFLFPLMTVETAES